MAYEMPLTRGQAILVHLRHEIVTGGLAPDTIIKDAEVASRLGVSITPVREAIAQLTAEGLIDGGAGRTRKVARLTQASAVELISVMGVLAGAGAEWGAPRLTALDLAEMRDRLAESVAASAQGDAASAGAAAIEFTMVMMRASGNAELRLHLDLVVARAQRLLVLRGDIDVFTMWHRGYGEVLDLLERGESARAVERYRQLYSAFRTRLTEAGTGAPPP